MRYPRSVVVNLFLYYVEKNEYMPYKINTYIIYYLLYNNFNTHVILSETSMLFINIKCDAKSTNVATWLPLL